MVYPDDRAYSLIMGPKFWAWAVVHAALGVLLTSPNARAKGYKSGEFETKTRYGFGAFEARIRAAQGPGAISTFFLWRPDSDKAPAVPWHEIDFELGIASGDYQTQIMTPGSSPPLYRTDHAIAQMLSARPYQGYFTYRIEWTPDYIAFFVDGKEVRRETDKNEFGALFSQNASGDTPANERMELRTGVWPGAPNISSWSGVFDGSSVPTGHFVDYLKIWDYTPNQANQFATVLLDEQFNSLNSNATGAPRLAERLMSMPSSPVIQLAAPATSAGRQRRNGCNTSSSYPKRKSTWSRCASRHWPLSPTCIWKSMAWTSADR